MDTRSLNTMNNTKGEITKSQFLNYLQVQKSSKINMFGYDTDIQREDNYSKCHTWFIDKKQSASLSISLSTGLVEFPLIERKDGTIFDPITDCDVDVLVKKNMEVSLNSSQP